MSSTNRGYARHKSDYYVTPTDQIEKFLDEFSKYETVKGNILDPCAGGDEKHPAMSYPTVLKNKIDNIYRLQTVDIRRDSKANIIQDYLEYILAIKRED